MLASAVKPVDGEVPNPDDLYPRIIWLVNAVRHHLAIEHDMVFESACMDIGAGD